MRKITDKATNAFISGTNYKSGNTQVIADKDGIVSLQLYGHRIAFRQAGKLFITNCGYFTATTKERLNGIPNVSINQKAGIWYLNGKKWDGKLTEVKK